MLGLQKYRTQSRRVAMSIRNMKFSTPPQMDAKAARKAKIQELQKSSQSQFGGGLIISTILLGLGGYVAYDIRENPKGTFGKVYHGSALEKLVKLVHKQTFGQLDEMFLPSSDKLLPDFGDPAVYGQLPPGTVAPPLLVVDLEKTLIGSVHDSVYGWRHVKRPGLDRFIRDLSQYYEIVIHSENDLGVSQDILLAIDPENRCHKLGSASAEMRGDQILKRLDLMNRDMRRIVLIDDNPNSAALFPNHTLIVKPFTDVTNTQDTILFDLIPFLQAFVHEDVKDIPAVLNSLGTHEAEEAVVEYRMRLHKRKYEEESKRNRGLGGLLRGGGKEATNGLDDGSVRSSILSPKDIVGVPLDAYDDKPAGPKLTVTPDGKLKTEDPAARANATKKKGKLFSSLDEWQQNKDEEEMRKRELMNKIAMERQMGKQ
jgi:import inner membrane translocase subunit TIM50|eukprot:gene60-38_t